MKTEQELSDLTRLLNVITESELNRLVEKIQFDKPSEQLLFWRVVENIADNKIAIIEEIGK